MTKKKWAIVGLIVHIALNTMTMVGCGERSESSLNESEIITTESQYVDVTNQIEKLLNKESLTLVGMPRKPGWSNVSSGTMQDEYNYWNVNNIPEDTIIIFAYMKDTKFAIAKEDEYFMDSDTGVSAIIEAGVAKYRTPDMYFNCSSIYAYDVTTNEIWIVWHA